MLTVPPPPDPPRRGGKYRFRPHEHLRRPVDFKRVYDGRRSASNDFLIVYAAPNGLPHNRLGLSVSRKFGGAVQRNRLRRLYREAYRLTRHQMPTGLDLILIPRGQVDSATRRFDGGVAEAGQPGRPKAGPRHGGAAMIGWLRGAFAGFIILGVRCYQRFLRPVLPAVCRFQPSCSEYMILAVTKYGPIRGAWRGVCRICRCHPWNAGGYDPP